MAAKKVIYACLCTCLLVRAGASLPTLIDDRGAMAADPGLTHEYTSSKPASLVDSANRIIDPQSALAPFVDKLKRIRSGSPETASILHIGDSHIQAGFLTGTLRRCFQSDFGNAGRGLVVPLRLMATNEPVDYRITSPNNWGNSTCRQKGQEDRIGLSATGITSGDTKVEFTVSAGERFSIVRAFHHPRAPWLREPEELSIGTYCPDSDGPGITSIYLNDTVRTITLKAAITDSAYNYQTYYGFSLETGEPGVLYHSVGVNGAAFAHYRNNPCVMSGQAALAPDMVVISLGTNDAYGNNYREDEVRDNINRFLDYCGQYFLDVPLLLVVPMESCRRMTNSVNGNVTRTGEIIKETAVERGISYWDMYAASGGRGANRQWYDRKLMSADRLHPTKEGYVLQGEMLYDAFARYYNEQVYIQDGGF